MNTNPITYYEPTNVEDRDEYNAWVQEVDNIASATSSKTPKPKTPKPKTQNSKPKIHSGVLLSTYTADADKTLLTQSPIVGISAPSVAEGAVILGLLFLLFGRLFRAPAATTQASQNQLSRPPQQPMEEFLTWQKRNYPSVEAKSCNPCNARMTKVG